MFYFKVSKQKLYKNKILKKKTNTKIKKLKFESVQRYIKQNN